MSRGFIPHSQGQPIYSLQMNRSALGKFNYDTAWVIEKFMVRFDTQHKSITHSFDGKLILSPVTLKPGDKVLDSGAGSCELLCLISKMKSLSTDASQVVGY